MRLSLIPAVLAATLVTACVDTSPTDIPMADAAFAAASAGLTPVFNPMNGNYYLAFDQLAVTWDEANAAANALRYKACSSHLATITSQEENDFITVNFPAAAPGGYWLGGVQLPNWGEPSGGWGWVTGEPFYFTNWNVGEPNNAGPYADEDRLHFAGVWDPGFGTTWNDEWHGNSTGVISGYVVEFDCNPTGPVVERVSGSGHFVDPQGGAEGWRTFSFTARKYADGSVIGQYQIHNRNVELTAHGNVTCFEANDGQIWLGGFETSGPYADTPNNEVGWTVVDNGEGAAAPPDQIGYQRIGRRPGYGSVFCTYKPATELFDVESGNIQVGG